MMPSGTEREPLLQPSHDHDNALKDDDTHVLGPRDVSKSTRYGILAGMFCASFLSSVNMTLVPTMIPSISSDFHKSYQASWLGTSYLLATCTFTPLYGRLADILGRRRATQLAIFFATLGTLACGFSPSMETLIAARFLSGMGGGGLFTLSSIVASDLYSLRSRSLTQSVGSMFNGLGMGLGGPIGGLISDRYGWRASFLIQIPLFIVAMSITSYNLTYTTPGQGKSTKKILKSIDYGGSFALLFAVGSCLFLLSTRYNEGLPWSDARVIAPLVLMIAFAITFVLFELYVAPKPVMEPSLLKQKVPVLVSMSNFLVANCNFTVTYFFPMYFQTVLLTSSSVAGAHLMPNSISMSLGSLFTGWMIHRTGKYKNINVTLGFLPFVGTLLILFMREDSGFIQKWLSIIPLGFGNAVVFQTTLIALLAHVPVSDVAVATSFGQLFRGIGQVAGVAVSSAIFQSVLDRELAARITVPGAGELIDKIRRNARLVVDLDPELQRPAIQSYKAALTAVFVYACVSTALSYLVRLPIPEHSLESRPNGRRLSTNTRLSPTDGSLRVTAPEDRCGASTPEMRSGSATPAAEEDAMVGSGGGYGPTPGR